MKWHYKDLLKNWYQDFREVIMRAKKTFFIGLAVSILSLVQLLFDYSGNRWIGLVVGLFFIVFGWKIGWTRFPNFTVLLGHFAVVIGCMTIAYAVYQIPTMTSAPSFIEVLDMPLFWGLFVLYGGNCMIKHSYCSCVKRMHHKNNPKA